uniref:BHLH domain-containing protein n=1 Tax=Kalanchoe fedtschenkoi TaxID=63787 RepID=A0A7N0UBV9_KALFE
METKNSVVARKVQKADREKLRRDRLNEHFLELGNTLDPERPRNDKATILTDTVQELKDLTTEVSRLKADYAALSEESRELTQEKHELREEKASLKADIDNLNLQYQQRVGVMFPWTSMDPSVVLTSPYPYPYPLPAPTPIAMHPTLQPFPFFANQNAGLVPTPSSTYMPYPAPAHPRMEQISVQYASGSQTSSQRPPKRKSSEYQSGNSVRESAVSNDVETQLELKMPGSSSQQDLMSEEKKGKQPLRKEDSGTVGSSCSRCSSSGELQDNSSRSIKDTPKLKE